MGSHCSRASSTVSASSSSSSSPHSIDLPEYTLAEVSTHNKQGDLWVIVNQRVYDVSKFSLHHPGGEKKLLLVGGRDATEEFNGEHESSLEATEELKKHCIGRVKKE